MRRNGNDAKPKIYECPNCGSTSIETRIVLDKFQYGVGAKAVELEALVPFRNCADCNFEYTDSEAEDLRHEAVCRHLGVMTPAEIIAVRKKHGLTRSEFADKTRIGEASLARWETGELIQNPANDAYMYLLSFPENLERLENRHKARQAHTLSINAVNQRSPKFRSLMSTAISQKRQEAAAFQLRPAA
jgi:DNA-binding transcriptional regulator YiaG